MQLTDICRICLIKSSKTSNELFFPIDEGFEKKFNEITNLTLHKSEENSKFPKNICITCVSELEGHYNYRCGLIEKQKRLNVLLGIKSDYEQNKKDPVTENPKEIQTREEVTEQEYVEEISEEQTILIEDEEQLESQEILEQDSENVEEILCNEEEEPIEEIANYETFKKETADEYEMDQDYIDEEDGRYYFVKDDDSAENFIVFEDPNELSTCRGDVKPTIKRKYQKQPKDAEKQFKCWIDDCEAVFSFRSTMRKHMLSVHHLECDKSTCLICGAKFDKYSAFLSHVKTHTRKSECNICKLRFVNDEKMLAHKARVHANDLLDRCYPCGVNLIVMLS